MGSLATGREWELIVALAALWFGDIAGRSHRTHDVVIIVITLEIRLTDFA